MSKSIRQEIIEVQLISLMARRDKCMQWKNGTVSNILDALNAMELELLDAQIAALKEELKDTLIFEGM